MVSSTLNTELLQFLQQSPTPFHVVQCFKDQLKSAGYVELYEQDKWNLSPGGKYYVTRNGSSLVVFAVTFG